MARQNDNLIPQVSAIVQARITSSRLPGKVLMKIKGKPMLWHVLQRLKFARRLDSVILAIPCSQESNPLEKFAKENKIKYFRGSEEDVLSRYYEAAHRFKVEVVVRITADCPLIDPRIVDQVIEKYLDSGADYATNTLEITFPRGFDVEVFSLEALEIAFQKARKSYQREHVTPYIKENPRRFKLENLEAPLKLVRPEVRLTVDTKEDLKLVREVYKRLYTSSQIFYIKDILNLLDSQPELLTINAGVQQKRLPK